MDYQQTLSYIHARPKFNRILGNANLRDLLHALDDPQERLSFVHLAGTNGKGSTAAILAKALQYGGYRTGLFISPFIERFNERIQINGEDISDAVLAETATRVRQCMEQTGAYVSEFAFILAVGFCYFAAQSCDIVILEAGMGGLLDATNVITESLVSVLTLIGMDHMQYLGNTLTEIAQTKCGIIKERGTVVSYPCQREEVFQMIQTECAAKRARFIIPDQPEICEDSFVYRGHKYTLKLSGVYQPYNAVTALAVLEALKEKGFSVSDTDILSAVAETTWKARFERVSESLIIDGSHNIDGMHSLRLSLEQLHKHIILIIAMMQDKDYEACVREIAPVADKVIATQIPDMTRSLDAVKLSVITSRFAPTEIEPNPADALRRALSDIREDCVVCTCGSLYLAGEIRKHYMSLK